LQEEKLKKNVPSINPYISMTGMYRCKLVMSKKLPQGRRSWDPTFLLRQWYRWPRTEIGRCAQSSTNYKSNKIYKFPIHILLHGGKTNFHSNSLSLSISLFKKTAMRMYTSLLRLKPSTGFTS